MQIEVSESTINRIADRIRIQGSLGLSGSEIAVRVLDALSRSANGLTFTELVEEICESAPKSPQASAREMAENLGLVGAFESGFTDLSTNSKHMTGFGQ